MKKSISILLVVCMLLAMIPAVSAEGEAAQVGSTAELQSAFAAGGYIVLADSFTLTALAEVPAGGKGGVQPIFQRVVSEKPVKPHPKYLAAHLIIS